MPLKLLEGQLWKTRNEYIRILYRDNLSVGYKTMKDPLTKEGEVHQISKKEFCRLLKGAELLTGSSSQAVNKESEE